jgi:hypothetical protein
MPIKSFSQGWSNSLQLDPHADRGCPRNRSGGAPSDSEKTAQGQACCLPRNPIQSASKPIPLFRCLKASGAIQADEDQFTLLQGDIVSTEAAYLLGQRITRSAIRCSRC